MADTLTRGITFGTTENITNTKLHNLVDDTTITIDSAIPIGYLDTDGTLDNNSDTKVASQKAVKTYVTNAVGGALTLASQAEAEAGTDNSKYMSSLRTSQSIAALANAQHKFYVGSFTRDMTAASGDVPYTGVGFMPKFILFMTTKTAATLNFLSWGICTAANQEAIAIYNTSGQQQPAATSVAIYESTTQAQTAVRKSFDADGFTLTWTKAGSPSAGDATVIYAAIG